MSRFEIKKEHLFLLQNYYISWNDCEFGSASIDCKRPYGNSSVELDILEMFGWEDTDENRNLACKLHEETKTVLQICLRLQKFETGIFENTGRLNWIKID